MTSYSIRPGGVQTVSAPAGRRFRLRLAAVCVIVACLVALSLPASLADDTSSASVPDSPGCQAVFERRIIILNDHGDLAKRSARAFGRAALAKRHKIVVEALKREARSSQEPILATLRDMQIAGDVASFRPFFVANCIAVEATPEALERIRALPGVTSVEDDSPIECIPETPEYRHPHTDEPGTEEGLRVIRAPEVWDLGITGAGVLLGHLDSGENYTHPALSGRWRGEWGYDPSACWLDLVGTTSVPTDTVGHGTQTMGILCGMAPGDTIGVAWGARFISARLNMSSGASLISSGLAALEWLLDPDGDSGTFDDVPRIVSNSWGLDALAFGCYNVFDVAMDNCEAAGIALFWAAGNEGNRGPGSLRVPANRAVSPVRSFSVGAFNCATDSLWDLSSIGPTPCTTDSHLAIKPEMVAPGYGVRSASLGSTYAYCTGTSFSVPHVAGTAALMLEANPDLWPDSLRHLLLLTAADKGPIGEDNAYGYGQVDAYGAVMAALGGVGWVKGHVADDYGWDVVGEVTVAEHPQQTRCDSLGRFVLSMPAGLPFTLQITAPTFDSYSEVVVLDAGDTLDLEITLLLADGLGMLSGTVMDCFGEPGADAQVVASGSCTTATFADGAGRFHVVLPEGFYDVAASDGYCAEGLVENVQIIGRGITDIEIVLPANPAHLCSEPDAGGYAACDDTDPGGPVCAWLEIAPAQGGRGVVHNLGQDGSVAVALPFPVMFYGNMYQRLHVNANGNVTFSKGFLEYSNTALPRLYVPAIYPFWDDLTDSQGGDICSSHEPSQGVFVVEWSNLPRYDGQGTETFELILRDPSVYPTTGGGAIVECRYGNLSVPTLCTVGIEGGSGGRHIQYVYNGSYSSHAMTLAAGRAIRFQTGQSVGNVPVFSVLNPSLAVSLPAGYSMDTALVLQNTGDAPLAYELSVAGTWASMDYQWITSRDAGGPPFEFMEISGIGQNTGISRDDTTSDPHLLPWHFPFYGRYFDGVAICSNGYISFTSCMYDHSAAHYPLSDAHDPYFAILPYWVDLDPSTGGAVYKYYDQSADRFIIEWYQIRRYGSSGPNRFEIVLYRDGTIEFSYNNLYLPLNSGTVGIKGRDGSQVEQLAYNQSFLASNLLVRFSRPDTAAARCRIWSDPQGVIPPASQKQVPIRLTNDHLDFGSSDWSLDVATSDPANPYMTVTAAVQNMPDPSDLELVVTPTPDGITLRWRRVDAPFYCVFRGTVEGEEYFETSVTDTFVTLPYNSEDVEFFDVRLCDTAPPNAAASPRPRPGTSTGLSRE